MATVAHLDTPFEEAAPLGVDTTISSDGNGESDGWGGSADVVSDGGDDLAHPCGANGGAMAELARDSTQAAFGTALATKASQRHGSPLHTVPNSGAHSGWPSLFQRAAGRAGSHLRAPCMRPIHPINILYAAKWMKRHAYGHSSVGS